MTSKASPSRPRAVMALATMVALIILLHLAARFGLRGPDAFSREGFTQWAQDPVVLVGTVARWLAVALSYYLAVVIFAVSFLGAGRPDSRWSWLGPSNLTSLIGVLLGVSAVTVPLALHVNATGSSGDQLSSNQPLVLQQVEPLTLTELDQELAESSASATTPDTTQGDDLWVVECGESFWSIARETLLDTRPQEDLTDQQIATYWRVLIEANKERLVEPGNPDLILPGQELILPPSP